MCGILAILSSRTNAADLRKHALKLSSKQRHRGPDWNGIRVHESKTAKGIALCNVFCHERLGVVDPTSGAQPLQNQTQTLTLTVNGEIYNQKALREDFSEYHFFTDSDCEPIIPLYEKYGDGCVEKLDGVFAFCLYDSFRDRYLAARDAIGVCSMYIGWGKDGSIWFSSEMKALTEDCERFEEFPPGHYWSSELNQFVRWYNPPWYDEHIPKNPLDLQLLRESFEASVVKRLMTDVPFGVLLSGGLDSSLVASIVCRNMERGIKINETVPFWYPRVHTFSIGLKGSPDLKAAKEVATFLQTAHHEFHFTIEEGIDALQDVIYHIESYDVTTIRASTPMFLLSRKIKSLGVKMVLSGEGADEVFGGYLYFHFAPSAEAFHRETCKKIKLLSKYDCLRANKSTAAWGVEARVPFLDKDFLDVAMSIDPKEKMVRKEENKFEKYILRKAFDVDKDPYLPSSVLWRQKEQFSDGVGYGWIDSLRDRAEREVSDEQLSAAKYRFPYNTPTTKEAYFYRSIFHSFFPQDSAMKTVPGGPSIACSTAAAVEWMAEWKNKADPSGRAIATHVSAL